MSIWVYGDTLADKGAVEEALSLSSCIFCGTALVSYSKEYGGGETGHDVQISALYEHCCATCGWWTVRRRFSFYVGDFNPECTDIDWGAVGVLKQLDLRDQSIPLNEIRSYLMARYSERFCIDPWRFEEVVASVYKDLGFEARVTARSNDGGVDIILDGPDQSTIGIQVKRYRGKVKVDHVRALVGALVDADLTRGVFVTTSEFQPGAQKYVARQQLRGWCIELVDAARFYDALGLAQRKQTHALDEYRHWNAKMTELGSQTFGRRR